MAMGWINPRAWLGWVRLFLISIGLGWVVCSKLLILFIALNIFFIVHSNRWYFPLIQQFFNTDMASDCYLPKTEVGGVEKPKVCFRQLFTNV